MKIFFYNNLQPHFFLSNLIYICRNLLFYQAFIATLVLWNTCHLLISRHHRYLLHKKIDKYLENYSLNIFQKMAHVHEKRKSTGEEDASGRRRTRLIDNSEVSSLFY